MMEKVKTHCFFFFLRFLVCGFFGLFLQDTLKFCDPVTDV